MLAKIQHFFHRLFSEKKSFRPFSEENNSLKWRYGSVFNVSYLDLNLLNHALLAHDLSAFKTIFEQVPAIAPPRLTEEIFKLALEHDFSEGALFCITRKMALNYRYADGNTPLILAVSRGMNEVIQALLNEKPLLNERDKSGNTALHWAVKKDNTQAARMLVQAGADTALKNHKGHVPFDMVFEENSLFQKDALDFVALLYILNNHTLPPKERIQSLMRKGMSRQEIFFLAVEKGILDILKEVTPEEVKTLKDPQKNSLLHIAAGYGHGYLVRWLRGYFPLEPINCFHQTPLHLAIKHGHDSISELLLEKEEGLTTKDLGNNTAFHYAAFYGRGHIMQIMLCIQKRSLLTHPQKTSIDQANKDGLTPLEIALIQGHALTARHLIEQGQLLQQHAIKRYPFLPFHFDVIAGDPALLCRHISPEKINITNPQNETPLHLAIKLWLQTPSFKHTEKDLETIRSLVECGANINLCNSSHKTPLDLCYEANEIEIAKILKPELFLDSPTASKATPASQMPLINIPDKATEVPQQRDSFTDFSSTAFPLQKRFAVKALMAKLDSLPTLEQKQSFLLSVASGALELSEPLIEYQVFYEGLKSLSSFTALKKCIYSTLKDYSNPERPSPELYIGIGLIVRQHADGTFEIQKDPDPSTPAGQAGFKQGHIITHINNQNAADYSLQTLAKEIRLSSDNMYALPSIFIHLQNHKDPITLTRKLIHFDQTALQCVHYGLGNKTMMEHPSLNQHFSATLNIVLSELYERKSLFLRRSGPV